MKIASSTIDLVSTHTSLETTEKKEGLRVWVNGRTPALSGSAILRGVQGQTIDRVTILGANSPLPPLPLANQSNLDDAATNGVGSGSHDEDDEKLLKTGRGQLYLLHKMIEALTGRELKICVPDAEDPEQRSSASPNAEASAPAQNQGNGWGLVYSRSDIHYEAEETAVAAEGIIRTADGQEIKFTLSLRMSRAFQSEETTTIRAGDAARQVDPLVINFEGNAADLTDTKFAFDLDSDGKEDSISFVGQGSGFLVLDKNGDSLVNNGSELFGPNTGNGFAELAAYDEDGNNWIDESDSVYDRLSVWTKTSEGAGTLHSLNEKSVGAIYLGSVESPFDLKDRFNNLHGQVAGTGIYLSEDGEIKTVQQLDLVV